MDSTVYFSYGWYWTLKRHVECKTQSVPSCEIRRNRFYDRLIFSSIVAFFNFFSMANLWETKAHQCHTYGWKQKTSNGKIQWERTQKKTDPHKWLMRTEKCSQVLIFLRLSRCRVTVNGVCASDTDLSPPPSLLCPASSAGSPLLPSFLPLLPA